jgi:hypothetical protein
MSDSFERAGTVGFRCAADAVQEVQPAAGPMYSNDP